ncbi:MAG TPA: outer membrane beta-barrel protein [Allosphingosinicella sp.]|jgi:outer membrane immunogenic protein
MKKIALVAVAAASFAIATPAFAAGFTGPRVGATVGIAGDDFFDTGATTFGIEAGYDAEVGTNMVVGGQVEYQNDFDNDFGHELAATARLGVKAGPNALVYATGGYTNFDLGSVHLDGYRVGAGAEFNLGTSGANLKVEQRYANYELGGELFQTVVGVGFRF